MDQLEIVQLGGEGDDGGLLVCYEELEFDDVADVNFISAGGGVVGHYGRYSVSCIVTD